MEQQIFLEKNRSKFSVNVESRLNLGLSTKTRLLPSHSINGDFSMFEQYNIERDNCDKYRMIFVVNPICTNVLFNMQTEVVQWEGSESAYTLGDSIIYKSDILAEDMVTPASAIQNTSFLTRAQAIKDTEYSHPSNGGFEYHCGTDIFNNHMLRNKGFIHVNKMNPNANSEVTNAYNTINDFLRDGSGDLVYKDVSTTLEEAEVPIHLYTVDDLYTFKKAYLYNIKEKDGWVGFTNPGNIDIPNSDNNGVLINRMFANKKACEFIDMYPDRSLYSFVPKYNKYRHRTEKNWDYCLTYPYAIDKVMVDTVCSGESQALKADVTSGYNVSSIPMIVCRPYFKHTFKPNEQITVFYYDNSGKFTKYPRKVRVASVGNNDGYEKDRVFSIRANDVIDIYPNIMENGIYYKKNVNGCDCEYYFRKYRKIKGFDQNGNRTANLKSDLNKLSYAENIYGDRVAQVVYTDDIDLFDLYDHMGRPVSEIYFTTIKRNAGREKWLKELWGDESVEYSHCFGEVTSGLDMGVDPEASHDYNIRFLHNVDAATIITFNDYSATTATLGETIVSGMPKCIEHDITIGDDVFYGNLVEFDLYNYKETELSPVLHRFNTVQRENCTPTYANITYDNFLNDDYDVDKEGKHLGFHTSAKTFSEVRIMGENEEFENRSIMGNIRPEGYFYNPHSKISVRENEETVMRVRGKLINYAEYSVSNLGGGSVVNITAPTDYKFLKHDFIAFYNTKTAQTIWGEITNVDGLKLTIALETTVTSSQLNPENGEYRVFYTTEGVPLYAKFVPSISSFVWRSFRKPSEMEQNMELYDTPFANGRFYIEKNINFFLRRQDPNGEFGLMWAKNPTAKNPMEYFDVNSVKLDLSQVFNFYDNLNNICY